MYMADVRDGKSMPVGVLGLKRRRKTVRLLYSAEIYDESKIDGFLRQLHNKLSCKIYVIMCMETSSVGISRSIQGFSRDNVLY